MLVTLACFGVTLYLSSSLINHALSRILRVDSQYLPRFAWGWLLYIGLFYLLAPHFSFAPLAQTISYITWAVCIILLGVWFWKFRQPLQTSTLFGALGCFAVAVLSYWIGPYYEFPSDPVQHVGGAKVRSFFTHPEYVRKIDLLLNWLWSYTELRAGDMSSLRIYAAAMSAYFFGLWLRFGYCLSRSLLITGLVGLFSLFLMGNNHFSFYRYYVFSDTWIAYAVFIEALLLLIAGFLKEQWRYWAFLPLLMWFCWRTHPQEVLLLLTAGLGWVLSSTWYYWREWTTAFRKLNLGLSIGFLLGMAGFAVMMPSMDSNSSIKAKYFDSAVSYSLDLFGWKWFHHDMSRLTEVLGVVGWCAVAWCCWWLFRLRGKNQPEAKIGFMLASLCCWPVLILCVPVTLGMWTFLIRGEVLVLYRLVYGSLYWVALAWFIGQIYLSFPQWLSKMKWCCFKHLQQLSLWRALSLGSLILVVMLGAFWTGKPFYGRLPHLVHTPPKELHGEDVFAVVPELNRYDKKLQCPAFNYKKSLTKKMTPQHELQRKRAKREKQVVVLSDVYTSTYLRMSGFYTIMRRRRGQSPNSVNPLFREGLPAVTEGSYPRFLEAVWEDHVCFVLLNRNPHSRRSWLAGLSHHWPDNFAQPKVHYPVSFVETIQNHPETFVKLETIGHIEIYYVTPPGQVDKVLDVLKETL